MFCWTGVWLLRFECEVGGGDSNLSLFGWAHRSLLGFKCEVGGGERTHSLFQGSCSWFGTVRWWSRASYLPLGSHQAALLQSLIFPRLSHRRPQQSSWGRSRRCGLQGNPADTWDRRAWNYFLPLCRWKAAFLSVSEFPRLPPLPRGSCRPRGLLGNPTGAWNG